MISRRRFLTISASMALAGVLPANASQTWRGKAFGADVSITLSGDSTETQPALAASLDTIWRMERLFSLYDPSSALSALNRDGSLEMQPEFGRLIERCDEIHHLTGGLFDPTVQPLFAAMLQSGGALSEIDHQHLSTIVGWRKVSINNSNIRFARPEMALTLNGIAQGFATDRVTDVLAAYGFENATVNVGEYRTGTDRTAIAIANSDGRKLARPSLQNAAIATTSASGYSFSDGTGHILRPDLSIKEPCWKTVSVLANTATIADGLSTAIALTEDDTLAKSLYKRGFVQAALLEDMSGAITKIGPI